MTFPLGRPFGVALLACLISFRVPALSYTFSNTNLVAINDSTSPPTKAGLYPSTLTVTGLTGQVITKAAVTLTQFTHEFPSDVTILLVGPAGQKSIVISEVGGQVPMPVTNLTITLDDNGDTLLTGPVVDQAALHGLLRQVRDLGMPLISVTPVEPHSRDLNAILVQKLLRAKARGGA